MEEPIGFFADMFSFLLRFLAQHVSLQASEKILETWELLITL